MSTVGKISSELLKKSPESRDPIEIQREVQKTYMKDLLECIDINKSKYINDDFFIVVITKNEKLMPNVFRNFFFARKTCPTPDYDQTVFKYHKQTQIIEYIWTIPSRDASFYLKDNALQVVPEERPILNFVLQFADGTLFKLAKKLNGEKEDSPLLKGIE